jgi:1-acyl-sn-glycerol-3-phosphate acyltransferase
LDLEFDDAAFMLRILLVGFVVLAYLFLVGPYCLLHAAWRRSPNILYSAGRFGCRLGLKLGGIRRATRGLQRIEPNRTYLFLANHQSYCDPPALIATIPLNARLILKKELRKLPLLGLVMEKGGFVFIDRKDRVQSIEGMKQAVRQLQRRQSFLIYPEGTRTRTGRLGAFKKGPFIMAIEAGVPIIPVSVSGSYEIMPPDRFRITPGTISITFHPAIETAGLSLSDREELMDQVRRTIAIALGEPEATAREPVPTQRKS